jgi:hypothetical protein
MALRLGGAGPQNITAHNNIFYVPASAAGLRGAFARIGAGPYNITASKNLRYRGAATASTNDALEGIGTIVDDDPLLEADHIHLSNASWAAIGQADSAFTVSTDIDNEPRPGAAHAGLNDYDLGADQNSAVPVEISGFAID